MYQAFHLKPLPVGVDGIVGKFYTYILKMPERLSRCLKIRRGKKF
jgi:hypothetical protein